MDSKKISNRLVEALEQNAVLFASLGEEGKQQLIAFVDSQLQEAGLVSREEFDALRASLNRASARIEKLEQELSTER